MGDPRQLKKKFSRPGHPWQLKRMEEERGILKEFGLKNKKELWKANSKVKTFASEAKRLIALRTPQAELEKKQLLARLARIGLLGTDSNLNDVLSLTTQDLLGRRLQTLVLKKGLARTATQARQFIAHGHILVGNKNITAPGTIITVAGESSISFNAKSNLANNEHPERTLPKPTTSAAPETPAPKEKPAREKRAPKEAAA